MGCARGPFSCALPRPRSARSMATKRRICSNDPDHFCYICGEYIFKKNRRKITDFVEKTYSDYFGIGLVNQDREWTPDTVCKHCLDRLRLCTKNPNAKMRFAVPMIWREPTSHATDCYFCCVNVQTIIKKKRNKATYPCVPSVTRPLPYSQSSQGRLRGAAGGGIVGAAGGGAGQGEDRGSLVLISCVLM